MHPQVEEQLISAPPGGGTELISAPPGGGTELISASPVGGTELISAHPGGGTELLCTPRWRIGRALLMGCCLIIVMNHCG